MIPKKERHFKPFPAEGQREHVTLKLTFIKVEQQIHQTQIFKD